MNTAVPAFWGIDFQKRKEGATLAVEPTAQAELNFEALPSKFRNWLIYQVAFLKLNFFFMIIMPVTGSNNDAKTKII
jgi:hypothetical protein